MKNFLGLIGLLLLVVLGITRFACSVGFKQGCSGYLKLAADASTVQLAEENLSKALEYIERKGLTHGYTSIFWETPDEDMGFWYRNLSESLSDLRGLSPDASFLEKSNMLIKLRETLLDDGDKGQSVTAPRGVEVYPSNMLFVIWGVLGLVLFLIGFGRYLPTS